MQRFVLFFILLIVSVSGKTGFGPTDQDWGYITVREKSHIFWWLHYTTSNVTNIEDKPLIIWLQGGPGSSSTGYGNFAELGIWDTDLKIRNSSWVQFAHILFVDNPVGTGFSYVEEKSLLTSNNTQIAQDFMVFLTQFFVQNPVFETVPLYIFTESYGGKMTVEITLHLIEAMNNNEIECNLKGIALGDSWISPVDSVMNYAPFLLNMGIIEQQGYEKINRIAVELQKATQEGKWAEAFGLWRGVEYEIRTRTYGVDMYNVLTRKKGLSTLGKDLNPGAVDPEAESKIKNIMNDLVRKALDIDRPWGTQNEDVFDALSGDFMTPVVHIVEKLLNNSNIKIAVYTGQLDLIVDTPGTLSWISKMNWRDKEEWNSAERMGYVQDGYYQGYVKKAKNFALYWVDRSGHMVPADNPAAMTYILQDVINSGA